MASTYTDRYQRNRRTPNRRPRPQRQLEPFAISTPRYEELIAGYLAFPFLSLAATYRLESYARRVAGRTGESPAQVIARLS